MNLADAVKRPDKSKSSSQIPRPPLLPSCAGVAQRSPLDIDTMVSIGPPWQAIKEWIPDDESDLDWFNRPRKPPNPDPDGIDQSPGWKPVEIQLDDGRILVLEST